MIVDITAGALVIALSAQFFARKNKLADPESVTPPDCSGVGSSREKYTL